MWHRFPRRTCLRTFLGPRCVLSDWMPYWPRCPLMVGLQDVSLLPHGHGPLKDGGGAKRCTTLVLTPRMDLVFCVRGRSTCMRVPCHRPCHPSRTCWPDRGITLNPGWFGFVRMPALYMEREASKLISCVRRRSYADKQRNSDMEAQAWTSETVGDNGVDAQSGRVSKTHLSSHPRFTDTCRRHLVFASAWPLRATVPD